MISRCALILRKTMLLLVLIFVTNAAQTSEVFAVSKSYPYAIQVGVFENAEAANRFYAAHKAILSTGLILKSKNFHVLYGAYESKTMANAQLSKARKIDPSAYVIKLSTQNQTQIKQLMAKRSSSAFIKKDASAPVASSPVADKSVKVVNTAVPFSSATVINKSASDNPVKVINTPLQQDVVINGTYGFSSINFNVSNDWLVKDSSYLELYFSHANTSIFPDSSLTVLINNVPIESRLLNTKDPSPIKMLVSIPPNVLTSGFNQITVKTYLRTAENLCENENNPANWMVIHKKSYLHLAYTEQLDTSQLLEYPFPYVKSGEDMPLDFTFLYDQTQPNAEILRSLYTLSADLGRLMSSKSLNFKFATPKNLASDDSYIYTGTSIPESLKRYLPKGYNLSPGELFISEIKLNENHKLLLIISKKAELLSQLTEMLNYSAVISQLNKETVVFSESDLIAQPNKSNDNIISFKELGYSNVTFEGTKSGSAGFYVDIPKNWMLTSGSKLVVETRFSSIVDAPTSTVTAIINGIPIGSRTLEKASQDNQILEFSLPDDVITSNRFNVVLSYTLGGDFDCGAAGNNKGLWAFISNDSYLQLNYTARELFSLEDLASPFVSDGIFNNLNIALSKNARYEELALTAAIMGKLGHQTIQSSSFEVSFDDIKKGANNLIIGTADQALIQKNNTKATVPYNPAFSGFVSKTGLFLLANQQKEYATAQILYDKDSLTSNLWISSITPAGLEWAGKYLYDFGLYSQVKGDVIFVSRSGLLQQIETIKPETAAALIKKASAFSKTPKATFENIRNFLVFLGALIGVIILILVMTSKKKKA